MHRNCTSYQFRHVLSENQASAIRAGEKKKKKTLGRIKIFNVLRFRNIGAGNIDGHDEIEREEGCRRVLNKGRGGARGRGLKN